MSTKKVMKNTVKEQKAISGLAFLVESELDKSSAILAVKGITEKLQKMAKDLADMEGNDILPILDSMRLTFGPELTDHFRESTVAKIRETMDSVMNANEAITTEIGRLETHVNGGMTNDMAAGDDDLSGGAPLGGDVGDDIEMGAEEDGMGDEAPDMEMGAEDDGAPPAEAGDDLDAAFDAAAGDTTAAGRARKESIERNVKALRESRNPDLLVFETFRRTLRESHDAVRSARAVATAFAIDFEDVVAIIKEGKTIKDEKGRSDNPFKKDRSEDRKTKKRERPSDLDEGKDVDECEMTEGKTIKDEKGRSENPFKKDRSEDRKTKKRERPSDLDEASFGAAKLPPAKAPPFGKKKADPHADVPSNFADMKKKARPVGESKKPDADKDGKPDWADKNPFKKGGDEDRKEVSEKWAGAAKLNPAKKGMFDGKTKEELQSELSKLKASGPHKEGSAGFTKMKELEFAIRAKGGWKKAAESKGFKTGGVAESARDAAATTRQMNERETTPQMVKRKFMAGKMSASDYNRYLSSIPKHELEKFLKNQDDAPNYVDEGKGDVFLKHQKAIALKTLRMTDAGASIMGGMTKDEARAVLRKCGYSDARIAKLDEDTITENPYVRKDKHLRTFSGPRSLEDARAARDELKTQGEDAFLERGARPGTYKLCVNPKKKEVEEAVLDTFERRLKAKEKAEAARRAKGFGAMQQKAKDEKKPVEEGVDHAKEAARYERLAREAHNQVTSAKPPEYYERMAKKHRDLADKPIEEASGVKALIMKKRTEAKPFAKPFKAPKK